MLKKEMSWRNGRNKIRSSRIMTRRSDISRVGRSGRIRIERSSRGSRSMIGRRRSRIRRSHVSRIGRSRGGRSG
jgi:hypothetical protein